MTGTLPKEVTPFKIDIPEDALTDLKARLARVRLPDEAEGEPWRFGVDLAYMRDFVRYWERDYDWRKQEAELNRFSQFKARVGGIEVHFIHEKGEGPAPYPLLLSHGWPGSFVEYQRLIPLLTKPSQFGGSPDDAFTVIVPSLPGHGFSFAP